MGIFKSKPAHKPVSGVQAIGASAATLVVAHYAIAAISAVSFAVMNAFAKKPETEALDEAEVSDKGVDTVNAIHSAVDRHFTVDPEVVNSILKRSEEERTGALSAEG